MRDDEGNDVGAGPQMGAPTTGGEEPWHLWGNTQTLDISLAAGAFGTQGRGLLNQIKYARPDTWHWLWSAAFKSFTPAAGPPLGTDLNIQIIWELSVGVGRSIVQSLGFDVWNIPLPGGAAPPVGRLLLASQAIPIAPLNRLNSAGVIDPNPPPNIIDEIVAENIYLNVRTAISLSGAAVGYPYTAQLEFTGLWAPKHHARPDWFQVNAHRRTQFPGNEVPGR
jgi:hypothetical protein